jgi:glycosyltransferase involved in cell wall biosynthesis
MRVAVVHDWLTVYAGAEKVLEQLLILFPQADIFTIVDFLPKKDRGFLDGRNITTSFVQNLPFASKKYRSYIPLMPLAIEQFDLSKYDLVISSSHAVAKGVITGPGQLHVCVCYTPIRYAWDMQHEYLKESSLDKGFFGWIAKYLLHKMRIWDLRTSNGVDDFIAISRFIEQRIWKVYRRESTIIYPPVDVDKFQIGNGEKSDFYLVVSRIVPYKKVALIAEAFAQMPDKKLVIIGDGPDFEKLASLDCKNIELLGYQPYDVALSYMQRARAFIFAAKEDFGIAPVEAQACGTPVIAYAQGGVLETVIEGETGVFFCEQTKESICDAVRYFEQNEQKFDPQKIRKHSEKFSNDRFYGELKDFFSSKGIVF